uniref:Uncharacterized protein n=1 Tax=Knipowitschia caucasica TaxID=637954 RepID=A0AAV2MNU5_KNICA
MARRGAEEEPVVGDDHPGEAAAAAGLSGGEDNTTQGSDNPLPEPPAAAAAAAASSVRADASPASAPTGPQRKRARQRPTTSEPAEWEREILSTLRARSAAAPPQPYSDDQHFLLSLLPLLQKDKAVFCVHSFIPPFLRLCGVALKGRWDQQTASSSHRRELCAVRVRTPFTQHIWPGCWMTGFALPHLCELSKALKDTPHPPGFG